MVHNVQCSSPGATAPQRATPEELLLSARTATPRRALTLAREVALAVALAASLAACAQDPTLSVQVCSDLSVPTELDAVRVVLFDGGRKTQRFASVFELIECPAGRLRTLPQVLEVPSPGSEAWLRVEGMRDGIAVLSVETRLLGGDGESRPVPVSLEAGCLGQACPLGQTCLAGACAAVPYHSETPMRCVDSPVAGAPDAGVDADAGADTASDAAPELADAPDVADTPTPTDATADADPGPDLAPPSLCTPTSPFLQGGASP